MNPPRRFRVREENGVTTIEWRWIGPHHALALVWLPMVCGVWFFWYTDMANDGRLSPFEICFLALAATLPIASKIAVAASTLPCPNHGLQVPSVAPAGLNVPASKGATGETSHDVSRSNEAGGVRA